MRQDSYIILVVIVSKRFLRQFLFALFYFQLDKVNVLSECKSEMLLYTVSAKSCHACAPQDRLKITHKFQYWAYTAAQAKYLGTYVFHNVMRLFQSLYKQFCKIIVLVEETTFKQRQLSIKSQITIIRELDKTHFFDAFYCC